MFWPILSSTGTTLAAFGPMLFWPGVSGKFMSYLPITVIILLSASLVTAMLFMPVIGGLIGKSEQEGDELLSSLSGESRINVREMKGHDRTLFALPQNVHELAAHHHRHRHCRSHHGCDAVWRV
jgi:multidrug efflux pump subunit AcrB